MKITDVQQERMHWDDGAVTYDSQAYTDEILALLLSELQPGRTLEIGAGKGRLTSPLSKNLAFRVYGIDISTKMLDYAPKDRVKYRLNDGRNIPYEDNFFENIFSVTVFQHIPDNAKISYIKEAARTLKTGGIFFVQFIDGTHKSPFDQNILTIEMDALLREHGFEVTAILDGDIHPQWTWIKAVKL